MSITPMTSLLRPILAAASTVSSAVAVSTSRSVARLPFYSPCTGASSSQSFSTSPPAFRSRERRMKAKAKRDRHVAATAERASEEDTGRVDHILGYLPRAGVKTPWDGCRLQRVLLRAENIYNTPPTDYSAGESPERYLPGLSTEDEKLLFGALPFTSTSLKARRSPYIGSTSNSGDDPIAAITAVEEGKVEQMQRMLDLRNASKRGIETVNRQRVIEEFGGVREGKGENTGSSEVQAALLTQKIRSVAEHLMINRKDNSNRRALRVLVHQRQQILRYFSRKQPEKYDQLLSDLGLERRGVEGEITL